MRYAETHSNAKVLVIDLCPQSNSSMILLGGGTVGDERVVELCSRDIPKSVVGYVSIADCQDDWMVFVDTNPSFSIYTQMAVAAVNRLLTPINADDSSKTAASAMVALLHGTNPPHPIYGSWTFTEVAKQQKVRVPQIHLLIGNRLTQFEGPATAFAALSDATSKALYDIYKQNPSYFVKATKIISTKEQVRNYYSIPLRDFNTAGVVCAHLGRLLSSMKQGYYKVYGIDVKVNSEKIQECLNAIDMIVDRL